MLDVPLLIVALLVAAPSLTQADLTLVQHVEGGGQAGDQTIRIKGDKGRTDLTPTVSMITDGATGEMVTLMHSGKTYLKIPPDQTKSMMDQLQKYRTSPEPAKLQPTGKKEKVGEYDCDIYTSSLGSITVTYWLAKDYPNYQEVLAQLIKFQAGTISAMGKGLMPELKDFPGMIMKTEVDKDGKKVVSTLVSAKEENVDPKIFDIPKGYTEITSPALNFQPK
ncbi:MAG TPA: DUF4412 domain-containing protein [Chthoniobacter sp.]|jgi:hypothetical protein